MERVGAKIAAPADTWRDCLCASEIIFSAGPGVPWMQTNAVSASRSDSP